MAEAEGSVPTVSFHIFLVLAVALAAIAVVTDSAVLVVGAMVVGPEFSAVAAASAGIVLRQLGAGRGAACGCSCSRSLFAIAVVTAARPLVARATGLVAAADVTRPRPNTGFIWHPDVWSFIVAAARRGGRRAGARDREDGDDGRGLHQRHHGPGRRQPRARPGRSGRHGEIAGSLAQLGANIGGMIISGTAAPGR